MQSGSANSAHLAWHSAYILHPGRASVRFIINSGLENEGFMAALLTKKHKTSCPYRSLHPLHFLVSRHCHPVLASHTGISGPSCGLTEGDGEAPHQMALPTSARHSAISKSFLSLKRLYKIETKSPRFEVTFWLLILALTSRTQLHSLTLRDL